MECRQKIHFPEIKMILMCKQQIFDKKRKYNTIYPIY